MKYTRKRTHLNPRLIRQFNRNQILEIIRVKGTISQVDICRISRMGSSTVSEIINDLKKSTLIKEMGTGESIGGRRPLLFKFNEDVKCVIGVDIDVGEMIVALMDLMGNVKKKIKISLNHRMGCEAILTDFGLGIEEIQRQVPVDKSNILGIGVSFAGEVDENGTVIFSGSFGWRNVSLKSVFEERWCIPTYIDDISRARALGENLYGAGKGVRNMVYVNVGDGVGAGIIVDRAVYRGIHNSAGEIGHNTVIRNGPMCDCGKKGCLEVFTSGRAIVSRAEEGIRQGRRTILCHPTHSEPNSLAVERVFEAACLSDEFACEIVREVGYYLGLSVANIVNSFDPEMVILGGYVIEKGGVSLLKVIKDIAQEEIVNAPSRTIRIEQGTLGENVGVVGGAALVYQHMFAI